MKRVFPILILILATTFAGCEKKFDDAPFRCKIDGKEFTTTDDFLTATISGGNNFYIQATSTDGVNVFNNDPYGEIKFDVCVDSAGTYPLNLQNTWRWSNNGEDTYRASGADPGTMVITSLDFSAKRITGTFSLTGYSDAGATKTITEGFFDTKWN
jgi:hypothetical protein